jgi:hypothetical protein
VADFVGKHQCAAGAVTQPAAVRVGRPPCELAHDRDGQRIYLRPEDVLARPIRRATQRVRRLIEKIEFLGSYCHVRVAAPGAGPHKLTVYLSLNFLAEQQLAGGQPPAAAPAARAHAGVLMSLPCLAACGPAPQRRASAPTGPTGMAQAALALVALALVAFLALPLLAILQKALEGKEGEFVGLANFVAYAQTPALLESRCGTACGCRPWSRHHRAAGLRFAYALTRSRMPLQAAVSRHHAGAAAGAQLLSAISLIYWFGNQGVLKAWLTSHGHRPDLRRAGHRGGRDALPCFRTR